MKDSVKTKTSKRMESMKNMVNASKSYSCKDAIGLVQEMSTAKFNESIDLVVMTGIDPVRETVRGSVSLPHGSGKVVKVAVIAKGDKSEEAKKAGADYYDAEGIIASIKSGSIDFDVCVATPDMMGMVGGVARILGPKGLMPNPKTGTVTSDITGAVQSIKKGMVSFRAEKGGLVHLAVGKSGFTVDQLYDNIVASIEEIMKNKPSTSKGVYLKGAYLSSTMGGSVKLDIGGLASVSNS